MISLIRKQRFLFIRIIRPKLLVTMIKNHLLLMQARIVEIRIKKLMITVKKPIMTSLMKKQHGIILDFTFSQNLSFVYTGA